MIIVYANQALPESWSSAIFLAGPTLSNDGKISSEPSLSWRRDAIKHLEQIGYDGVVFVPEDEDGKWKNNYYGQIEWEEKCLNLADVIIFWIPRELLLMPGFTTNDEWGFWKAKDPVKLVLGTPQGAEKVRYQRYYAEKFNIPVYDSLESQCMAAVKKIGDITHIKRVGGELSVPLHIWRTSSFQNWYQNLLTSGNRLDSAKVEWIFRVGSNKQIIFLWILHVDIYIAAENRHKTNEFVIGRPDISTILLYEKRIPVRESRIVIIKEFRSPVSNQNGYVLELAGGSSFKNNQDPFTVAVDECNEEAGISLTPDRFTMHQSRQLVATTLAHRAHLFSAQLTSDEMDNVARNDHIVRGVEADTERTWAKVYTYGDILNDTGVDWSMLGMITSVLTE